MAEPGTGRRKDPSATSMAGARENRDQGYIMQADPKYLGFQGVKVTEWIVPNKIPGKVEITLADGTVETDMDAATPFFTFTDRNGNEMFVSAASAGHIDSLHFRGEDAGSRFAYSSLLELMQDVAAKLPEGIADRQEPVAISIEMDKPMGGEGLRSFRELIDEGVISEDEVADLQAVKGKVVELNRAANAEAAQVYVEEYNTSHGDSRIKLQVIRDEVVVPVVDVPKQPTTRLFTVWGDKDPRTGKKMAWTMAPGRWMPKHPKVGDHTDEDTGVFDEQAFAEAAEAWFETAMLTGKDPEQE